MRTLPATVRVHLPAGITLRQGRVWSFGAQLYDDNPRFHYEIARVPKRLGDRLELGLHFESRATNQNRRLLTGFAAHLLQIKAELGDGMEAEPWDRGWTKVYETMPLRPYNSAYQEFVASRMAKIIQVLHPIYRSLHR
jgi:hypothetical protein